MAGRRPRQPDTYRGHREGPLPMVHRGPGPLPPHPASLEEELEFQHRDIQQILAENTHVLDENMLLQRELTAITDEIRRLGEFIPKVHVDKEARARELIERGLKLEAELRETEPLRAEVVQLRTEAQKLNSLRQDLSSQVQTLTKDLNRARAENEQILVIRADIDGMRKELMDMRREFEIKKKANEELMIQKEAMEKNLISMAREIEKLRSEQMSAERRSRGLGAGGYGMLGGNPDSRYQGSAYSDVYGNSGWGSYDHRGPPRR